MKPGIAVNSVLSMAFLVFCGQSTGRLFAAAFMLILPSGGMLLAAVGAENWDGDFGLPGTSFRDSVLP